MGLQIMRNDGARYIEETERIARHLGLAVRTDLAILRHLPYTEFTLFQDDQHQEDFAMFFHALAINSPGSTWN